MAKSFNQILQNQATAPAVKKTKSNVPMVDSAPAAVRKAVDAYNVAKRAQKEAEAEMKVNGDVITDFASKVRDGMGFKGHFVKSLDIQGDNETVKYVTSDRYTINGDDEMAIRGLFGEDYDEFMNTKMTVTLKEEVVESEELGQELIALIGEANFARFFDVKPKLTTKENFDSRIYSVAKTQEKLDEIRTYVRPWKASIK